MASQRLTLIRPDGNIETRGFTPIEAEATLLSFAEVAELADALHSGCSARQGVEVRVLSSAPTQIKPVGLTPWTKGNS